MDAIKTEIAKDLDAAASGYVTALFAVHNDVIIGGRALMRGNFQQPSSNSVELHTRAGELIGVLDRARKWLSPEEISAILKGAARLLENVCPTGMEP